MSTTELDEVQSLLEHVLPDPGGYAQRLAMQVVTRWGQSGEQGASSFYPGTPPSYSGTRAKDIPLSDIIVARDDEPASELPIDTNLLLAAALGACECWGLHVECSVCVGQGAPGWTEPDPDLFDEFVKPAIARLSRTHDAR